jgi:hypothetical protein
VQVKPATRHGSGDAADELRDYGDEFVKTDDGWKIRRRKYTGIRLT